VWSWFPAELHF